MKLCVKMKFQTVTCIFLIFYSYFLTIAKTNDSFEKLPFCDENNLDISQLENLIFVSTLDGKVSALNALDGGSLQWTVSTGPGPMLSSSIHNLELTNNGHLVRMIPSLSGGLYKFNGENIEPIPITADKLLKSSSILFSDDLVISGGKESRTYGVSSVSGEILYECSMNGCTNLTENMIDGIDVLVLQRQTQTVRAVEARTGIERWNFSVGQHEMNLIEDINAHCHTTASNDLFNTIELKVIIPQGLLCAVHKNDPNKILWKQKLDAPLVTAWRVVNKKILHIDLFAGSSHWPLHSNDYLQHQHSPSIYIGMHKKQLYIQESLSMHKTYQKLASDYLIENSENQVLIPWKPFSASSYTALVHLEDDEMRNNEEKATTALSILYASEYVNGNGFYLYTNDDLEKIEKGQCQMNKNLTSESEDDDYHFFEEMINENSVQIIIVSLWYYWKEVLIISVIAAVTVHLLFTQHFIKRMQTNLPTHSRNIIILEKRVPVPPVQDPPRETRISLRHKSESGIGNVNISDTEFVSRYLSDFEHIACLGKGGFGVVFQAKNKLDDRHYAIKRIALPTKRESQDRVLREVKALAQLEHQNIVRYFNAWHETPPPEWQKEQDNIMLSNNKINLSTFGSHLYEATTSGCESEISQSHQNESLSGISFRHSNSEQSFSNKKDYDDSSLNIVFGDPDDQSETTKSFEGVEIQSTNTSISENLSKRSRPKSLDITRTNATKVSSVFTNPTHRMYLFIQMQLCKRESLREWLKDDCQRNSNEIMNIFIQIVDAVHYVHDNGLIHRDLKPSNIFFSLEGQIKIGDFGLVTGMTEDDGRTPSKEGSITHDFDIHTARVGTQLYMSPEQIFGQCYNYKVDIYSLGLIFFELIIKFSTEMERNKTLMNLRKNIYPPDFEKNYQQEYKLLKMMLSHQPEKRPTTYGIRSMPPINQALNALGPSTPVPEQWHFELPLLRSRSFSSSGSKSGTSLESGWEVIESQT